MDIDRKTLSQTYATKSDEELLALHDAGTLTELAYEVLENELSRRGVTIPDRPREPWPGERSTPRNKIWSLIAITFLVLVGKAIIDIAIHPSREERRKEVVDNIIETSRTNAMQKFLAGEELSSVEFVLIIPDIVAATNKKLPLMIDDITRWDSLNVSEGKAVYRYTVLDWKKGSYDPGLLRAAMYENIKNSACNDKWSWLLMKNDFTLIYSWHENDGNHLLDLSFKKNDCALALKDRSLTKP